MGNIEKLTQIYIEAFSSASGSKKDAPVQKKRWGKHITHLMHCIDMGKSPKAISTVFSDLRRDYFALKNMSKADASFRRSSLKNVVTFLAKKDIGFLRSRHSDAEIEKFLENAAKNKGTMVKSVGIDEKFFKLENGRIREQIVELVQTDPTVEFPAAREMNRHFHLHLGPTNSGKTYESIQMLKKASKGVYLGPLRLLALEIYDTLTEAGVRCSMVTGEEHIFVEDENVVSQTIETVDINEEYDIAVIDECQLIEDDLRGHSWSKAVLGLRAKEIYLCASANVEKLLIGIITACNDTYDITYHERKTPLIIEDEPLRLTEDTIKDEIKKGDCLITFSKKSVLDLAARLEMAGIKASVIYGKLPPETRKREVYRFTENETDVVVATDAIGMGVNLPIRRVIITSNRKFDGHDVRPLAASEVLQIAGRAGRFGIYNEGYVNTSVVEFHGRLKKMMTESLPDISTARLGFPKVLLSLDEELDAIISSWENIKAKAPYEKIATKEMLSLYQTLKLESRNFSQVPDGDDKEVLYGLITVPVDIKNTLVVSQWVNYCKTYNAAPTLEFPRVPKYKYGKDLERYEDYYKLLDLYHLFSNHMGKEMDEEFLMEEKTRCEEKIEELLAGSKKNYVRRCMYCRKPLAIDNSFRVCDECHGMKYRGIKLYR